MKDKSFVEKFMGFETPDEVKGFFKSEGLEVSDAEIKETGTSLIGSIARHLDNQSSKYATGIMGS